MFHAIGSKNNLNGCDLHYSYHQKNFEIFLEGCGSATSLQQVLSGKDQNTRAVLTFDDGHISNYRAAISIKEIINGCADFFVNANVVGKKNFMSWQQLREINQLGMSIQSHSLDHVYLSDLNYEQQLYQLTESKKRIEGEIGSEVTILAPPGGRYNQNTIDICKKVGYQHLSVSRPGRWSQGYLSARIPVLSQTSVADLLGCQNTISPFLYKQMFKYQLTGLAKKILGNDQYDNIRSRLLGDTLPGKESK